MEMFQTDIRHIVLAIKSSEENRKKEDKYLKKCTEQRKFIQPKTIIHIKRVLSEIKTVDEANKSLREDLLALLMKSRHMRGAVSIRKREWSYYNPENFDSEYIQQFKKSSKHPISSECKSNFFSGKWQNLKKIS